MTQFLFILQQAVILSIWLGVLWFGVKHNPESFSQEVLAPVKAVSNEVLKPVRDVSNEVLAPLEQAVSNDGEPVQAAKPKEPAESSPTAAPTGKVQPLY